MPKRYNITRNNVTAHEIIGLNAKVVGSTDKNKIGIYGEIIDESENTLSIETPSGIKVLPKHEIILGIELPDKEIAIVDGRLLEAKPEDRIKKAWRKHYAH